MNAYMATYVDDDMDDEVGIPAHLLTAQHQRWTILAYFQPIYNIFSAHLQYTFSPFFNLFFQPITAHYYSIYNKHIAHIDKQLIFYYIRT